VLTDAIVDRFLSALGKHSLLISPASRLFISRCPPPPRSRVNTGVPALAPYSGTRYSQIKTHGFHCDHRGEHDASGPLRTGRLYEIEDWIRAERQSKSRWLQPTK
jgi:hypothetical protein